MGISAEHRNSFSSSHLEKMFQISVSKNSFLSYEEKGLIPKAVRTDRGKYQYRSWSLQDLPLIGEKFGYLRRPSSPKIISVFSLKGGTGKTTFAFQLARTLALHNINTLVVGLDAQESITQTLNRSSPPATSDPDGEIGVFHILEGSADPCKAILPTDLPTLSYIPETIELSVLDRVLKGKIRKEYVIGEKIVKPILRNKNFDVIVFDCNPSWSDTVIGALACTDILVSPLGCDINSLKAARIFMDILAEFQDEMKHAFKDIIVVPTLSENNKMSQQILAKYRVQYEDLCSTAAIKRAVTVQEANALGLSLLETSFKSNVYQDFIGAFKEINEIMLKDEKEMELDLSRKDDQLSNSPAAEGV